MDDDFNYSDLEEAVVRLRRGELGEALMYLSRCHDDLSELHRLWERDRAAAESNAHSRRSRASAGSRIAA